MLAHPHIQSATPSDAERLVTLAEQTFRETFATDCSPDDMEAYVRNAFSLEQVREELADRANTFFLAFVDDGARPIGYAKLRSGKPDPCVQGSGPIELERLYVTRTALGGGVGASLMQATLDHARSAGYRTMWLGVSERNLRALAFYKTWGFRTVGDHVFQLGEDAQTDLIMERSLDP